jgi:hypothetical protein
MASPLQIQISVGTDGLVSGLKVATKGVETASESMRLSLKGMGDASASARKAQDGLLSTLRAFKSEQVQQGRIAKFYASELTSIIPASAGASTALRGVLGAGIELAAGGGALFAGFELAKVGIEVFTAQAQLSEQRALELRQAYTKTTDEIDRAFRGVTQSMAGELSKTGSAWQGEINRTKDSLKELQNEIVEKTNKAGTTIWAQIKGTWAEISNAVAQANEEGRRADALAAGVTEEQLGPRRSERVNSGEDDEIAQMQAKQLAMIKALDDRKAAERKLAAAEEIKIAGSTAVEVEAIEAKHSGRIAEIRAALAQRLHQLSEQADKLDPDGSHKNQAALAAAAGEAAEEEERRVRVDSAQKANAAILAAQKPFLSEYATAIRESDLRIAAMKEQVQRTSDAAEKSQLKAEIDAEEPIREAALRARYAKENQALAALEADRAANTRAQIEKQVAWEKQLDQQWINDHKMTVAALDAASNSFFQGFGNGLKGIVSGTLSVEQAFKDLATGILDSVLSAAEQVAAQWTASEITKTLQGRATAVENVTQNAGVAGSAAAAAMAGIPIFGPGMAAAAMAEMSASVLASMLPLASARGGFDIPAVTNPLAQLHEREMVLPADLADKVRGMSTSSGGALHVHLHAIDAAGVQSFVASGAFERAVRQARRDGSSI